MYLILACRVQFKKEFWHW